MQKRRFLLPGLACCCAALLVFPSGPGLAFTKIGGTLNVFTQRDWRIFNNFRDPQTNDNGVFDPNFPGWLGADLAVWKAAVEWGSGSHGNGSGDPTQANLGDGGGNLDFVWSGRIATSGNQNANLITSLDNCGFGGTLAYTLIPNVDGWKVNFCDEWVWADGPGAPPAGEIDLQGVACHEFGHAVGLGHTLVAGATMIGSTATGLEYRSIEADDISGVQCWYNVKNANKVEITGITVDAGAGMITVDGLNFTAANNEAWLTNINATGVNDEPKVIVTGLASTGSGTRIVFSIPPDAADGAIHIKADDNGGKSLSNSWPIDLQNDPGGGPFDLVSISPPTIEALIPGSAQTITIFGTGFTPVSTVLVDLVPVPATDFTVVDGTTITLNMPQVATLGIHVISIEQGGLVDAQNVSVVAPGGLVLECGDGDPLNVVSSSMEVSVSGTPGDLHFVLYSGSNVASKFLPFACLDIGNNFADLFELDRYTVDPSAGVTTTSVALPALTAIFYLQSISLSQGFPVPDSNVQSIQVVP